MEIKITTRQILKALYILSWIIFLGVCVDAGGIICNAFVVLLFNPNGASTFWNGIDLSSLYKYDPGYFLVETLLMGIAAVLKTIIFYLILKLLHDKKLDMSQPFSKEVARFIFTVSYLALGIGLFSAWGAKYVKWFIQQGVEMPDIQDLGIGGADVWLFMGVILFVIAQIFKRGIEIQAENDLTV
ncbi:DUF2975 domain-containing protein [Chitinophaga sp. SYP-B3965]|uniref:DUF2975 domain-containing protein n=1 Tax=Chitinophaga sp. SYP-B3965 TaxID=2663120 RepID=UPI0012996809|nr:DUF2975 domain-containing protein [Chitinophaga sp. SYP-B3965]MRG47303.1 DUF2975 domain-containing protein [Chitinophaga sp. SYP-B3965]